MSEKQQTAPSRPRVTPRLPNADRLIHHRLVGGTRWVKVGARSLARGLARGLFLAGCVVSLLARAQPAEGGGQPADPVHPVIPPAVRKTILVLGDSLAAGLGVDPTQAFPASLQRKIDAAGWSFEVVNAGVSGDTTAGGLRRIDWLLKRRVDVLILELGGNDGLRGIPVEATQTNLQAIIGHTRQHYAEARIVLAGMQMPPNLGEDYGTAFQKLYPDLAKANHAALIPFLLEGVGGKPQLNQQDGIHPTAEGHRIVADTVWKTLKPVLETLR